MLGVVVVIMIITMLAYPSLKSFSGRNSDASAATRIIRRVNRARDQARRRHRAYLVDFALMLADQPGGRVDFYEARSGSCRRVEEGLRADGDNELRLVE